MPMGIRTMGDLFDRYQLEEIPTKKPATQKSKLISLIRLRKAFSAGNVTDIESTHCFQYKDYATKKYGVEPCNNDIKLLSHCFSKAIEWGVIGNDKHPIRGLRIKNPSPPRRRYVTDDELSIALTQASPFLTAYIGLKMATGMAKGDLLSIKMSDINKEGLHYSRRKTNGKPMVYPFEIDGIDTGLRERIDACITASVKVKSFYLFSTKQGQPYIKADGTTSAFDSMWQRFMKRVLTNTDVCHFTEHDLRAKVASDTDSAHAQQLMSHANQSTTDRIYRRKADVVLPLKR